MAALATRDMDMYVELPPLPVGSFVIFAGDAAVREQAKTEVGTAVGGKVPAHCMPGGLSTALHVTEWPAALGGVILDISDSQSPVADMAALVGVLSEDCIVIAIGETNDVGLFRDLMGTGVSDYLVHPLADGTLHKALDKALVTKVQNAEMRTAKASMEAAAASQGATSRAGIEDVAPLVVACAGARGGVGTTTVALALASMLGLARRREALIVDLDVHYGSVMLALDLDPTVALHEALATPDRVDNLFIDQAVQRKSDLLCALGAEEAPQAFSPPREGAIPKVVSVCQRRFREVILDVPRGDPLVLRQALEAATDFILICDLTLAGARDAMRLLKLADDVAPNTRIHLVVSGATDPRRAPIKLADLERSVKRKALCQIAFDDKSVAAAVSAGKPLNEAAPRGNGARSLQPLVDIILAAVDHNASTPRGGPFWSKLLKPKSAKVGA